MIQINLISDTVVKPTKDMLTYMMSARVGDDVFKEDPTINALQRRMAEMFGMGDAIFCPSGTMTNQIAIKVHTQALDELICPKTAHVYQYETSGYAFNAGIGVHLVEDNYGLITSQQVQAAIQPKYDWLPHSALVVLENSTNKGGGHYYNNEEIEAISKTCKAHDLKLHLDGARLFNVLVETQQSPKFFGQHFDSISICLSKGLGAPVGSVLISDHDTIKRARRFRKVLGGGMRQAGYLAAAGIYALEHNIGRLKEDNDRAKILGDFLAGLNYVSNVVPVKTNIVICQIDHMPAQAFVELLKDKGLIASAFGPQKVRFVTHLEIDDKKLEQAMTILKSCG